MVEGAMYNNVSLLIQMTEQQLWTECEEIAAVIILG